MPFLVATRHESTLFEESYTIGGPAGKKTVVFDVVKVGPLFKQIIKFLRTFVGEKGAEEVGPHLILQNIESAFANSVHSDGSSDGGFILPGKAFDKMSRPGDSEAIIDQREEWQCNQKID
jgi:hypothetical protein